MKELTKAEEQVMRYLWRIEKGFLKDIIEQFPEPKPAYTTVSTVIRVLIRKGFIDYNSYGKVYEYYPKIGKHEYARTTFRNIFSNFFNNSTEKFTSFFANDSDLSLSELEQVKEMLEKEINKRKMK